MVIMLRKWLDPTLSQSKSIPPWVPFERVSKQASELQVHNFHTIPSLAPALANELTCILCNVLESLSFRVQLLPLILRSTTMLDSD